MAKLSEMAEAKASARPTIPVLVVVDEKYINLRIDRTQEADSVRKNIGENRRTGAKETRFGVTCVPVNAKGLAAGEVEITLVEGDGEKKTGRFSLGVVNMSFRGFKE